MIFIRADANEQIATGHIMRSKTVAYRLQELGRKVAFLVSDEESIELLKGEFQYIILHTKWNNLCSEEELGKVKEILTDSAQKENEIPVLFVDSYFVDNRYFKCLNQFAKTVMVDDLGEDTYDADIVINYNITYENYRYEERYKNKNTRLILGAGYVPLRPQFAQIADKQNTNKNSKIRILLMCGGGDKENALCTILNDWKVRGGFSDKEIWVVAGRYNPKLAQLKEIVSDCSNVKLWCDVSDMASLMGQCDVAVTSASTVLYECCALSLPAVAFAVADNQIPDLAAFNQKCGMPCVGDLRENQQEILKNIYESARGLCSDKHLRENLGEKMHRLVDGKGAQRLANAIDRTEKRARQ
jgi:UDP-2,4-diacetamido-2,4,6-trideoxy-beta-L-altropyranose hydrolase